MNNVRDIINLQYEAYKNVSSITKNNSKMHLIGY